METAAPPPPDPSSWLEAPDEAAAILQRLVDRLPGGGEPRAGQVEMARRAAEAIETVSQVSIRAGTGTGKSLGALAAVIAAGRRTVVATSSKALQDQYQNKDLPFVEAALKDTNPFTWAVLKGRSNYACRQRLSEAEGVLGAAAQESLFGAVEGDQPDNDPPGEVPDHVTDEVRSALEWVETTELGDIAELDFEPSWDAIQWITTSPESCPGADKCSFGDECFAENAIAAARSADIVLVNTALLGADLVFDGAVLGGADAYVIDEAHDAEDVLASAFGAEITAGKLRLLAGYVKSGCDGAGKEAGTLLKVADQLADELESHRGQSFPDGLDERSKLGSVVTDAMRAVGSAQMAARRAAQATQKIQGKHAKAERARKLADTVFMALNRIDDDRAGDAMWVEDNGRSLKRVPVQVGGLLASKAWTDKAVVFTSATFPQEMARRLGFDKDAPFYDVGTPFDHREAAWLYVPPLLGQHPAKERTPNHRDWLNEAWEESKILIKAAGGRTMLLCTSRKNTEAFAERARAELDFPILVQGDLPKPKLIAAFAEDPSAVCIGTLGLWQGVDVPGESLSCVILDKVPFPRPDDPLWQARIDHVKNLYLENGLDAQAAAYQSFLKVNVPRASALLAQGAGRLVRKATDRGLICVLDPRLAEKGYRKQILDEMPPMGRTRTRADAVRHLMSSVEAQQPVPAA